MAGIEDALRMLSGGGEGDVNLLGLSPDQINAISQRRVATEGQAMDVVGFMQKMQQAQTQAEMDRIKFAETQRRNRVLDAASMGNLAVGQQNAATSLGQLNQRIQEALANQANQAEMRRIQGGQLSVSQGNLAISQEKARAEQQAKIDKENAIRALTGEEAMVGPSVGFPGSEEEFGGVYRSQTPEQRMLENVLRIHPSAADQLIKPPARTQAMEPAAITQDKIISDAEARILAKPSSEVAKSDIDLVNQHTKGNRMWIWGRTPGAIYGTNPGAEPIDLGKIEAGLTADMVRAKASQLGVSVEALLNTLYNKTKPKKR